ncbi:MAG: GNAT family N-acetyltransferase [Stenotrophomonas sp.]|uniref:GNAT family N-acetyltransferase n=1 Tax=Stenotrophomonas sp. TaxID=69392 RepID=UPI003D6D2FDD
MQIRAYRPEDWPRLCLIHDQARMDELCDAGLADAFLPLQVAAEREGLFDYTVLVAEDADEVLGFVAFSDDELCWLYVDPACYRRGVGAALVNAAVASAAGALTIEVLEGNATALAFYQACGFHAVRTAQGWMPGNESFAVTVQVLEQTPLRGPARS